jgi:PAS domain S-box-containing protein
MADPFLLTIVLCAAIILLLLIGVAHIRLRRRLQRRMSDMRKAENRFKTIFEAANDAVIVYDPASDKIVNFNASLCDIFGYTPDEIARLSLETIYSGSPIHSSVDAFQKQKAALDGFPQIFEWMTTDKSGNKIWVEISMKQLVLSDKPHLLIFIRRITERKKTEERLYRLIHIVDQIGEGVAAADLNGNITYVNQAWADMHGYSPASLIGKHMSIFHSDEQNAGELVPFNRKVLRTGFNSGDIGHVRSDGTQFYTHMTTTIQRGATAKAMGFISVATDLSEQKRVEEALRESEIKFRHLYNLSPQPISLSDLYGNIVDVNQKFCEVMQYPRNDAIGKNILELGFPADARQRYMDLLTANGELSNFEITVNTRDGSVLQLQLFSKLIRIKNDYYSLTVFHDVTAQRRLENQLLQSQKKEAIGTLAGGIAHDFNNILSAIIGYIELAKISTDPESKTGYYLESMLKAANRAVDLVRQILSISRQAEQKRKRVRIRDLIEDVIRLLRATLPASIIIREDIAGPVGMIEADPGQIHQVLMNLCTNAGQSMQEKGGILTISLGHHHVDEESPAKSPALKPGSYVKLTVSDTGHGIPAHLVKRIFDPYYTTREKATGTGLGLAVAQGIVQKHGGFITFSSEEGKGTSFYVFLPVADHAVADDVPDEREPDLILPRGSENILLVDDEESIIHTGREMLEFLGYKVTCCLKSPEALNLFKSDPCQFDLVITDMTMPQMNGDRFAKELIAVRPDIPIVICTGYNPQIDENAAARIGAKAFMFKPLTFQQLAFLVRNVLDGKS